MQLDLMSDYTDLVYLYVLVSINCMFECNTIFPPSIFITFCDVDDLSQLLICNILNVRWHTYLTLSVCNIVYDVRSQKIHDVRLHFLHIINSFP